MIANTPENKARFFALYFAQEVLSSKYERCPKLIPMIGYCAEEEWQLELTPISQITDEDAEYCIGEIECSMRKNDSKSFDYGMSPSAIFVNSLQGHSSYHIGRHEADYLRLKGYALKWCDLKVETLVEWGWVKLKGSGE